MPQMAPMNWFMLYLLIIMIFMCFNFMNYYLFLYSNQTKNKKYLNTKVSWKW